MKTVATARRNVKPLPESLHCYQILNETVSQNQMTVSQNVARILLCDNVSDRSPSIDSNLNEIVQKTQQLR
nr:hypothetical protein [Tanacetum cinerariifolium]